MLLLSLLDHIYIRKTETVCIKTRYPQVSLPLKGQHDCKMGYCRSTASNTVGRVLTDPSPVGLKDVGCWWVITWAAFVWAFMYLRNPTQRSFKNSLQAQLWQTTYRRCEDLFHYPTKVNQSNVGAFCSCLIKRLPHRWDDCFRWNLKLCWVIKFVATFTFT